MTTRSFRGVPPGGDSPRAVASVLNAILAGKLNATLDVTLTADAASTTVNDPRLTVQTFIGFMPTTANAASELAAGTLYASAQGSGTATLTHANASTTDRTFRLLLIG